MVVVRPQNSDDDVNELFALLAEHSIDLKPDSVVKITEIDSGKSKKNTKFQFQKGFYLTR